MIKENEYHNIVFSEKVREDIDAHGGKYNYAGNIKFNNINFEEVVTKLAKANPTWRLVIADVYVREVVQCNRIVVTIDGEEVGQILGEYVRGNYGVKIHANKLSQPVRSSNVARALGACRKGFSKLNTAERLTAAEREATVAIQAVSHNFKREINGMTHDLSELALVYALGVARRDFETKLPEISKTLLHKYDEASVHMVTINSVVEAFGKKKTALMVRDGDRYIVKTGDSVALYTPAELPQSIKGKVGMLKLCEDNQMVDNVGCRVSEEVFVVLIEEGAKDE